MAKRLNIPGFNADASVYRTKIQYSSSGTLANVRSGGLLQPALALGGRLLCIRNCLATCELTSTFSGDCWSNCACACGFWPACGDVTPPGGLKYSSMPSPIVVAPVATPSTVVVVPRVNDDGQIDWVGIIIVNGDVIGEIPGPYHIQ